VTFSSVALSNVGLLVPGNRFCEALGCHTII